MVQVFDERHEQLASQTAKEVILVMQLSALDSKWGS